MKNLTLVAVAIATLGLLSAPQAQQKAFRLGFVSTQALFVAHPSGKEALAVLSARDQEIKDLNAKAAPLLEKLNKGSISAAERQTLEVLQKSAQAVNTKYTKKYNDISGPMTADIDPLIAKVAKAKGYSMVLDAVQAKALDLVVYADEDLNLTDEVVAELKKK
jgi:Skp family chaperone for outer membrane proteins